MASKPLLTSTNKTLTTASNLANLLPTGTVLTFQALLPLFSNNGDCHLANKYLTISLITICSLICFVSSFTDSFIGQDGKLYYGIATPKGFYVFNDMDSSDGIGQEELDLEKYRICGIDFVHAIVSLIVFFIFSVSNSNIQNCLFSRLGVDKNVLIMNLPLGAGVFGSFLFMLFPTKRRGIGYGDINGR